MNWVPCWLISPRSSGFTSSGSLSHPSGPIPWSRTTAGARQLNPFLLVWNIKCIRGVGSSSEAPFTTSQAIVFEPSLYNPLMRVVFGPLEAALPAHAENWWYPGVCSPLAQLLTSFNGCLSVKVQFPCFGLASLRGTTYMPELPCGIRLKPDPDELCLRSHSYWLLPFPRSS